MDKVISELYFKIPKVEIEIAELMAENIRKGDKIGITGELQQQRWEKTARSKAK